MCKPTLRCLAFSAAALAATIAVADPDLPHRFSTGKQDRGLATIQSPSDGRSVAAWSFRSSGQYDVAISVLEPGTFRWSEPVLFGATDALQQEQPSVAVDTIGNFYVAYVVRETGQIFLTTLRAGFNSWSDPIAVTSSPGRRTSPLVRVIGDRLVVAFRSIRGVDLIELPLLPTYTHGVNDGPDTIPPGTSTPLPNGDDDGSIQPGG